MKGYSEDILGLFIGYFLKGKEELILNWRNLRFFCDMINGDINRLFKLGMWN